jgi:hypothetical protein
MLLLESFAMYAAKFLASRFSQDVWPIVSQTLTLESTSEQLRFLKHDSTARTQTHDMHMHSPTVKIIGSILKTLSELLHYPDLLYKHVADISKVCLPYLSNQMPPLISQLSMDLYTNMMQLDADAVYTALSMLSSSLVNPDRDAQHIQHVDRSFRFAAPSKRLPTEHEHDLNTGLYDLLSGRNMYTTLLPLLQESKSKKTSTVSGSESEYMDNVKVLLQKLRQQSEAHYSLL